MICYIDIVVILKRVAVKSCVRYLFGELDYSKVKEISLALAFFICLFSATCFFFDAHQLQLFGHYIHFPVGLLFFPATYVISNIIQHQFGRKVANTVVACSFIADLFLVAMSWIISYMGDRADYFTVFKDLPIIMMATFIFLTVSSAINIIIFEKLDRIRKTSIFGFFIGFFTSITVAELVVSSMSMPLLFYKQGFNTNVYLTIFITVSYKVLFNLLSTILYVLYTSKKNQIVTIRSNSTQISQPTV